MKLSPCNEVNINQSFVLFESPMNTDKTSIPNLMEKCDI